MAASFVLLALAWNAAAYPQLPQPFPGTPQLTDADLQRPNHVLTPRQADLYRKRPLPVGEFLLVVLPVHTGTPVRWRFEPPAEEPAADKFARTLKPIPAPNDPPAGVGDVRGLRREFENLPVPTPGLEYNALQVFRFRVVGPGRDVTLQFREYDVPSGRPTERVFKARVSAE